MIAAFTVFGCVVLRLLNDASFLLWGRLRHPPRFHNKPRPIPSAAFELASFDPRCTPRFFLANSRREFSLGCALPQTRFRFQRAMPEHPSRAPGLILLSVSASQGDVLRSQIGWESSFPD